MLLGYNTNGLQNHRLDDALRMLADHGFEAVGLTLDVGHLDPFRASAAEVEATGTLLAELGLKPVLETGARFVLDPRAKHEPTLLTREPAERQRRVDFYRRCAEIGRDLGAEVLSFWAGIDRAPGADSWAWLEEGVVMTCEAVRAAGLVPALEPEPGMAIETLDEFGRLRDALGSDAPDLTFDIGHAYVNESEPAATLIARWAPCLRQVHLEDMRRGVHDHLVPGEGDVDFAADLGALTEVKYPGPVCFELSRSSHMAPSAMTTCRNLWNRLVVERGTRS